MKLASSMTLDWNHGVTIDGIEFPFWVGENVEVTPGGRDELATVTLDVYVHGVIELRGRNGERRIYDPIEGDVAAWARRLVREGLIERIPDLNLPSDEESADV